MKQETAPTRTLEQIAASLIDMALSIQKRGFQDVISVGLRVYKDSPRLPDRFRGTLIPNMFSVVEVVGNLLRLDYDATESFSEGSLNARTPDCFQLITPSQEHSGLFMLDEEPSVDGIHLSARRVALLVSKTDLTLPENWLWFNDNVIHEGV